MEHRSSSFPLVITTVRSEKRLATHCRRERAMHEGGHGLRRMRQVRVSVRFARETVEEIVPRGFFSLRLQMKGDGIALRP
ncbi:hypothetical protein PUN28_015522 [Cardiocondyla obscurior]|uniref:Uncharacterized protein n=1 Tax=Cardiocondyla obscurior TaxID=286306 RepID=A0AAW2EX89_9HYME